MAWNTSAMIHVDFSLDWQKWMTFKPFKKGTGKCAPATRGSHSSASLGRSMPGYWTGCNQLNLGFRRNNANYRIPRLPANTKMVCSSSELAGKRSRNSTFKATALNQKRMECPLKMYCPFSESCSKVRGNWSR